MNADERRPELNTKAQRHDGIADETTDEHKGSSRVQEFRSSRVQEFNSSTLKLPNSLGVLVFSL
jgi:hypothetical protein